jgi:hypothetical protein
MIHILVDIMIRQNDRYIYKDSILIISKNIFFVILFIVSLFDGFGRVFTRKTTIYDCVGIRTFLVSVEFVPLFCK